MLSLQTCSRCLLDSSIPGITFDDKGECNFCEIHDQLEKEYSLTQGRTKLDKIIGKMKAGRNGRYDCVVGVSGGCDSSYLLHKLKEWGLRPLAVHFDNNWNTRIAKDNMDKMINSLNIDFLKIGVDKEEYDDICRAFLLASTPHVDIPNDIALATVAYIAADKMDVPWIINGHSFRTEGTSPLGWSYMDAKYIESIHALFGRTELNTFPNLWMSKWLRWIIVKRIKRIRPLWFIDYQKEEAKKLLNEIYGWEWYGGHHLENRYTIFCTNYLQPKKFDIDLRYIEYSALIRSGQMNRQEGLTKLEKTPEIDEDIIREVKTRLRFSDEEFERVMAQPHKTHYDYDTYQPTFRRWKWFFWLTSKLDLIPKTFYIKYTSDKHGT